MQSLGTIELSRSQYVKLVSSYLEKTAPKLIEDMENSTTLTDQISALAEEARVAKVRLDDQAVADNPVAADIRRRLDPIVAKVNDLNARRQALSRMADHARDLSREGFDGPPVQISTFLALSMMGLSPSELGL